MGRARPCIVAAYTTFTVMHREDKVRPETAQSPASTGAGWRVWAAGAGEQVWAGRCGLAGAG